MRSCPISSFVPLLELFVTKKIEKTFYSLFDALLLDLEEWVFIDISIKDELFIPDWEEVNNES